MSYTAAIHIDIYMGWNTAVGAAVAGVAAMQLYALNRGRRGVLSAEAYTTAMLPVAPSHLVVAPAMHQTRAALLDLAFGGLRSIGAMDPRIFA